MVDGGLGSNPAFQEEWRGGGGGARGEKGTKASEIRHTRKFSYAAIQNAYPRLAYRTIS